MLITALQGVYKAYDDKNLEDIIEKLLSIKEVDDSIKNNNIIMDFSPWGNSTKTKEKVDTVRKAIERNRVIRFKYIDINGKTTLREVEPVSLILKINVWYLHAYCRLRCDYRLFKISRYLLQSRLL